MNNIYKRGLFKRFLKDWTDIMFERQHEATKQLRTFTCVKNRNNNYEVENEKWFPNQLNSGEDYAIKNNNSDNDLLYLLKKNDKSD
jgi:hypothetical protein|uniref:Uncharacterized protein n=1 Tax=viral metagenome TaxID=1070528 RepID=A0A6C0ALJ1_9ZZZZ